MLVSDYDYPLPEELIADRPLPVRSDSRLMLVERSAGRITHHIFRELPDLLEPNDLLVLNRSKVIPARLYGHKCGGGALIEILLLEKKGDLLWEVLAQRAIRLKKNTIIELSHQSSLKDNHHGQESFGSCKVKEVLGEGRFLLQFHLPGNWEDFLQQTGKIPLPPYITKKRENLSENEKIELEHLDRERYQTLYGTEPGSAAAPTAGLHFDESVFKRLHHRGIRIEEVILHVGMDTFSPVMVERVEEHQMKSEWCHTPPETIQACQERMPLLSDSPQYPDSTGRIIPVGTTSCRTLESYARGGWQSTPLRTSLFLKPGEPFLVSQGLLTNFHLPKSTLLMLVSAFMGDELRKEAYAEAIQNKYRFYSYGDAMLIL